MSAYSILCLLLLGFDAESVGKQVILKDETTVLTVGNKIVERNDAPRVYTVKASTPLGMWVVADNIAGWVKSDEVVLIDATEKTVARDPIALPSLVLPVERKILDFDPRPHKATGPSDVKDGADQAGSAVGMHRLMERAAAKNSKDGDFAGTTDELMALEERGVREFETGHYDKAIPNTLMIISLAPASLRRWADATRRAPTLTSVLDLIPKMPKHTSCARCFGITLRFMTRRSPISRKRPESIPRTCDCLLITESP